MRNGGNELKDNPTSAYAANRSVLAVAYGCPVHQPNTCLSGSNFTYAADWLRSCDLSLAKTCLQSAAHWQLSCRALYKLVKDFLMMSLAAPISSDLGTYGNLSRMVLSGSAPTGAEAEHWSCVQAFSAMSCSTGPSASAFASLGQVRPKHAALLVYYH